MAVVGMDPSSCDGVVVGVLAPVRDLVGVWPRQR
jgi:hypothetical protein